MAEQESLCLWVAVDSLQAQRDRYAIWVLRAPHPSGHVHHDCDWSEQLDQAWNSWQSMFSLRGLPQVPHVPSAYVPQFVFESLDGENDTAENGQLSSYSSRYMQHLGISLWKWLFEGPVESSFERSQGIAIGQDIPLRLRLEIRDPGLIAMPWEIMQPQPGSRALSLNRKILFSRTSSDVDPLESAPLDKTLKILLVLGKDSPGEATDAELSRGKKGPIDPSSAASMADDAAHLGASGDHLRLEQEAQLLKKILEQSSDLSVRATARRRVDMLLQPTAAELSKAVEKGGYNVFFYSGHGVPGPDGGFLFLSDTTLSGTELAQVLTRAGVKLAVFNTCWGAQPEETQQEALPRSSLAEVLLHHGLPAVVAMRDSIADEEAISFIQVFAQTLAERKAVDEAVAIARQHLLTLYHFNQPAWTLPVLYMHPDFDGDLLLREETQTTQINSKTTTSVISGRQHAILRDAENPGDVWPIYSDVLRIGRRPEMNDLVISDPWVSSSHAEIFNRRVTPSESAGGRRVAYFLRDKSRYGTYYMKDGDWHEVHRQEVLLSSGMQIRFGSRSDGQLLEFVLEDT
ncbi:MAG: CHAT domain-containing protein [Cyanobacteria bacterium J06634_6]